MVKKLMKSIVALVGSLLGILIMYLLTEFKILNIPQGSLLMIAYAGSFLLFGIVFYLLSAPIIGRFQKAVGAVEHELQAVPLTQILAGGAGLIAGLILATLLSAPLASVLGAIPVVGSIVRLLLTTAIYIFLGYLGMKLATTKRDELTGTLTRMRLPTRDKKGKLEGLLAPKVIDTSAIIDGRIAEIVDAGFMEGELLVPSFVLVELQHIADSQDGLRRQKGRRGLDTINRIKEEGKARLTICDKDYEDVSEVDSKLIRLAKDYSAKVVTNDFNLNKLATVHGVEVLNINELANAMKPIVIPGEEMTITVIKDGKEHNQGLAYLDDGTMIVVENGRRHIGNTIPVLVTSILQTSAGKMIFAKPK